MFPTTHTFKSVSMALCKYSTFVGGTCGASSENPANVECVTIGQCRRELHGHLKLLKISDDPEVDSESKLLLMRAGMVHLQPSVLEYVVCSGGLELEVVELMCHHSLINILLIVLRKSNLQ